MDIGNNSKNKVKFRNFKKNKIFQRTADNILILAERLT